MSTQQKPSSLQSYQTIVYDRAVHPEFFLLKAREVFQRDDYELEVWIMRGAHLLRYEHGPLVASELVTDQESGLPTSGVVTTFLCAGERDFEHAFKGTQCVYMTSVQTETLSESLYMATFEELSDTARGENTVSHRWEDEHGPSLSFVEVERGARAVIADAFHLVARGGLVLRTQTMFELRTPARVGE